jgi:hypothetical protein
MRWHLAVLVGLLAAIPAVAGADEKLTPSQVAALRPEKQANVRGLVRVLNRDEYGCGSGFVVHTRGRRAFVLTNDHVRRQASSAARIRYLFKVPVGLVRSVVAAQPKLDYALLEADLVPGLALAPARLRAGPLLEDERVYSATTAGVGGYHPELGFLQWTLQDGWVWSADPSHHVPTVGFSLSSLPGNSGRPIFSSRRDDAVALHWGSNRLRSWAIPSELIVRDLRARLDGGLIDAPHADAVREIVDRSTP